MKRSNWMRWGAAAALAAGMAFAQAPATGSAQAPATGSQQMAPSAQQPRMNRQEKRQAMRERMARELNLTPAQRDKAKVLFGGMRENARPIREQLRRNHEAMESAIQTNNIAQIRTLSAKQAGLESQLTQMRAETMAKFYTMLTPAQKTRFQQIHQRMRQRWEKGGEEHPAS